MGTKQSNPIHDMCNNPTASDEAIIQQIAQKGYNPYFINSKKCTTLMTACEKKRTDAAMAMLTFTTFNINRQDDSGRDALSIAVDNGMTQVAMHILNTGMSRPSSHPYLFDKACFNKMSEVAMWLIFHNVNIHPWTNGYVTNPLVDTFVYQMPEVTTALLQHPSSDFIFESPLLYANVLKLAIYYDMPEVAMQLLDKDKYYPCVVDASLENGHLDRYGQDPMHHTFRQTYRKQNDLLWTKTAFELAYRKRMRSVFWRMYSIYTSSLLCVYGDKSVLMMMCQFGLDTEAVAWLEDVRSIPFYTNAGEETAFMLAVQMKLSGVLHKLREIETVGSDEYYRRQVCVSDKTV